MCSECEACGRKWEFYDKVDGYYTRKDIIQASPNDLETVKEYIKSQNKED